MKSQVNDKDNGPSCKQDLNLHQTTKTKKGSSSEISEKQKLLLKKGLFVKITKNCKPLIKKGITDREYMGARRYGIPLRVFNSITHE